LGGFISGAAPLAACSTPVAPPAAVAPVAAAEVPEPPSGPAEPAAMRIPELSVLTGMAPAELVALLGEPDFQRPEPPAELWQYRTADCVLDPFLYVAGGRYRVLGSATRDRHVAPRRLRCTAVFGRRDDASRL
jgi:hypothetical protein